MNFKILIKKVILYFLNSNEKGNNVTSVGFSRGMQNVKFHGENAIADRCNFSGSIEIGYATTLGYNNFIHGNVVIGKYCQIGADVAIFTKNHPTKYMSTYINRNLFDGELKKLRQENHVRVGNDVWIGHNVTIVGNVNVGNGAVLAAGSVVTKDVEPYAIVAGVPARLIRKRFTDQIIREIEEIRWWDKTNEELVRLKPLFFKDFSKINSIYDQDDREHSS